MTIGNAYKIYRVMHNRSHEMYAHVDRHLRPLTMDDAFE